MNTAQLRRVTAESFAHYRPGLIELLLEAVGQGWSLGFKADLDAAQARDYFDKVLGDIQQGSLLLWVVVRDEQVQASVQLELCQQADGCHRAQVQKMLVQRHAQRHGLGQQLMTALEQGARYHRRGLLTLDVQVGAPAEAFYRALGYTRVGEIPDYTCGPNGDYHSTALYFKTLHGASA
ncbi:GNAT family N-acetyltransferase [Pseudomonas sp. MMS21-TM103]|uniref:GNAT family N-acetyltransferase n=1 Tax=Pseudomonas sp. MMS21 TM103 TaxID=2886506 RepID=UPI001EDDE8B3|nr:GNAT family N-acetyltransferase [Pseudomonas sp. MMS21 TM103]MCG4452195.1 GNAT family N-acetyltransferase [Pseudomonas sp. MMS21 TM103]